MHSQSRNNPMTHSKRSVLYFNVFPIAEHSLAQLRQALAQAAICLSSGIFSHAAAQSLQHFAQHSHA